MDKGIYKRLPRHIGIIPDGNRRWAESNGYSKGDGYKYGIDPGFRLYDVCTKMGIEELTFYGFTQDNTKRPSDQTKAFTDACIQSVLELSKRDADILIVGNTESKMFPQELIPFTERTRFGKGIIKINFLVNYGWNWDISHAFIRNCSNFTQKDSLVMNIASCDVSRIDLIIRWGGRRRLSGFLPMQSVYADFYVLDEMWPEFQDEHIYRALEWYQDQDVTLGG